MFTSKGCQVGFIGEKTLLSGISVTELCPTFVNLSSRCWLVGYTCTIERIIWTFSTVGSLSSQRSSGLTFLLLVDQKSGSSATTTTCECTHLTNFALIFDTSNSDIFSKVDSQILRYGVKNLYLCKTR